VCALALLPTTILFGFNFPAVLALLSPVGDEGEIALSGNVGRGVAANTLGAIAAAIFCGFYFIPRFGSFRLMAGAACLNVALGMVRWLKADGINWKPLSLAAALLAAIAWTAGSSTFFSEASAAFGVLLYRNFHNSALTASEMADTEDVVFFKEGISATIASWKRAAESFRRPGCYEISPCVRERAGRSLCLAEGADRDGDARRVHGVRSGEHVATAVKDTAGINDQTGRVNFARDDTFGLNLYPAFGENNAVISAGDDHSIALDLAFHLGVLAEDQCLFGDNIALKVTIDTKRTFELQRALERHALIDKTGPLFAAAAV
jgi:hypothetical protein